MEDKLLLSTEHVDWQNGAKRLAIPIGEEEEILLKVREGGKYVNLRLVVTKEEHSLMLRDHFKNSVCIGIHVIYSTVFFRIIMWLQTDIYSK